MAGRAVDRRAVRPTVSCTSAAVSIDGRIEAHVQLQAAATRREADAHQQRVPVRIGDVLGANLVPAALPGRSHLTRHPTAVARSSHRVGHVARLQVSEARPVRDDVLQRLDIRVVHGRVVDVAQHPTRDREPHPRGRVARRPQTILPRKIEMRDHTRPARSRPTRHHSRRRAGGATERKHSRAEHAPDPRDDSEEATHPANLHPAKPPAQDQPQPRTCRVLAQPALGMGRLMLPSIRFRRWWL